MFWYAVASLTPAALLALGCLFGGHFAPSGVLSITVFVFFMDKIAHALPDTGNNGRSLSMALAAVHFPLLALGIWALATPGSLSLIDRILLFTGLGLYFGQVSNSNAHELIHATARFPRRVGAALYISLLHGHHVSAHLHVHHIYAATRTDPNSARKGEGFWAYALRALSGEFIAGWRAETSRRARAHNSPPLSHPYVAYIGGAGVALVSAYMIAGHKGTIIYLAIAFYAQLQLLLSDYVQHYGLRRATLANGKPEPIGPQHSWNAPKWYSSAMMLNAPKHSDHHLRPARAFPALQVTPDTMPILPHSLPVMAVLALLPPVWRRIMDHRVARWQKPA
ncbi:alkane 1-monooxygenase [Sulfitobacter sp. F26204]|uniref:alkane 1-monooxygenase n=1 Tax=Sulfitobacter sp. F26204 TaxID=2996014 RepID=UPI00225DE941|nr:alkane 1-monooxygenase [Sulfitobacter sp. F26204]MCX7559293.1 alkane 1-monooxygenase [Sulfitobacter sp. F26204]